MNYAPVTKLSSFGKGRDSDLANVRYIARFGTLADETGRIISQKDRAKAVEERLNLCINQSKTSFRVVISLPAENTNRARMIVEGEIRNRYSTFLSAYHAANDKGDPQPHMHFLIFNDMKNHRLRGMREIYDLRNAIGERFRQNNISFPVGTATLKPKLKQSEIHMKERGQALWLDDIRTAVESSLSACAGTFDSFTALLNQRDISISRQTPNSLTFQDSQERTARLSRLFVGMKNKQDIISRIAKKGDKKMTEKMEQLLRAERSFTNRVYTHAEELPQRYNEFHRDGPKIP